MTDSAHRFPAFLAAQLGGAWRHAAARAAQVSGLPYWTSPYRPAHHTNSETQFLLQPFHSPTSRQFLQGTPYTQQPQWTGYTQFMPPTPKTKQLAQHKYQ